MSKTRIDIPLEGHDEATYEVTDEGLPVLHISLDASCCGLTLDEDTPVEALRGMILALQYVLLFALAKQAK